MTAPPKVKSDEHAAYFYKQARESNVAFWQRFGDKPNVGGKRVLDFGCGHGALSVELAREGADVVGIDLEKSRTEWAKENAGGTVQFICGDVAELTGEFDIIVSKDTFEHVSDVVSVLRHLRILLAPHGQIWIGLSPLYSSPWGDHGRTGVPIPWGHVILPKSMVMAIASRHRGTPIRDVGDLELNGMKPRDFRRFVVDSGLSIKSIKYNQGHRKLLPLLDRFRRVPAFEAMATVSIYAILVDAQV